MRAKIILIRHPIVDFDNIYEDLFVYDVKKKKHVITKDQKKAYRNLIKNLKPGDKIQFDNGKSFILVKKTRERPF